MCKNFWVVVLALFLVLAEISEPTLLFGEVARVIDGDTVVVSSDGSTTRVRLAGIDAPELDQPFGLEAKHFLEQQVEGKTASLLCPRRDRYFRLLCQLKIEEQDINRLLVQQGLAWGEGEYYSDMEAARQQRLGLWQDANPVSPKQW